jgi:hypothetical protein
MKCHNCGKEFKPSGPMVSYCDNCRSTVANFRDGIPPLSSSIESPKVEGSFKGSTVTCVVLGLVGLVVGLYYLANPSLEGASVVNSYRLAIAQTLTISGSVFLAVGIRPRT